MFNLRRPPIDRLPPSAESRFCGDRCRPSRCQPPPSDRSRHCPPITATVRPPPSVKSLRCPPRCRLPSNRFRPPRGRLWLSVKMLTAVHPAPASRYKLESASPAAQPALVSCAVPTSSTTASCMNRPAKCTFSPSDKRALGIQCINRPFCFLKAYSYFLVFFPFFPRSETEEELS